MGLGVLHEGRPGHASLPDKSLSLNQGAIQVSGWNSAVDGGSMSRSYLEALADTLRLLAGHAGERACRRKSSTRSALRHGRAKRSASHYERGGRQRPPSTHRSRGSSPNLESAATDETQLRRHEGRHTSALHAAGALPRCAAGSRLKREALAVTVGGKSIAEVYATCPSGTARAFFADARADAKSSSSSPDQILKEINSRLGFLVNVGLDYLTLRAQRGHAVRRRGAAHPPGHADRLLADRACCTFWTSRRSACTSGTTTGCSTRCATCATWATR